MKQQLVNFTFLVNEYDEAIKYFTEKLEFVLLEDTMLSPEKRWVRIAPINSEGTGLLLAKATSDLQIKTVGKQFGDRVGFFLHTDNFWITFEKMKEKGVSFIEEPRKEVYGTVVVFKDLYGNKWDMIEPIK